MGQKIGNIFFVIVVAGLLLYVAQSGLVSKGLGALGSSAHSSSSSGGWFPSFNFGGNRGNGSSSGNGSPSGTVEVFSTSTINPNDIPKGFTIAQLSPYFHAIHLNGSYGGQFTLNTYMPASTTIDVTGWKIQSRAGGVFVPQAINLYDPSGLAPLSDIVLRPGDFVNLFSSASSFPNLRLNKCIGYIAAQNHTNPGLPGYCPSLDYDKIRTFSGTCQNSIQSIGSCQVPLMNNLKIPDNDFACMDYLKTINYTGCFNAHLGDADFISHEVWTWTGTNILDQYHDQVELLDRNGLVVDAYSY